jgi:hypothetical protein
MCVVLKNENLMSLTKKVPHLTLIGVEAQMKV